MGYLYDKLKNNKKKILTVALAAMSVYILKTQFYDRLLPISEVMRQVNKNEIKKVSIYQQFKYVN